MKLKGKFYLRQTNVFPAIINRNAGHRQRWIWGVPKERCLHLSQVLCVSSQSAGQFWWQVVLQISKNTMSYISTFWNDKSGWISNGLPSFFLFFFTLYPGAISPSMPLQKEETSFSSLALRVMCYCATHARQTRKGNFTQTHKWSELSGFIYSFSLYFFKAWINNKPYPLQNGTDFKVK